MNVHNKRELQNIATNHSTYTDYKDCMNICSKCTVEPYSFFTIDTILTTDNPLKVKI